MSRGGVGVELNPCFETLRTESFCCSVVFPSQLLIRAKRRSRLESVRNMCAVVKAGKESEGFLLFRSVPRLCSWNGTVRVGSRRQSKERNEAGKQFFNVIGNDSCQFLLCRFPLFDTRHSPINREQPVPGRPAPPSTLPEQSLLDGGCVSKWAAISTIRLHFCHVCSFLFNRSYSA